MTLNPSPTRLPAPSPAPRIAARAIDVSKTYGRGEPARRAARLDVLTAIASQ